MNYYYNHSPTGTNASTYEPSARSSSGSSTGGSGASRPASVSPQFSNAYTFYSATRSRFLAGRGFDLEDDLEFCPALVTERDVDDQASTTSSSASSYDGGYFHQSSSLLTSSNVHTPESSPTFVPAGLAASEPISPHPRVRKVIEIVNPTTGMKVSSPSKKV